MKLLVLFCCLFCSFSCSVQNKGTKKASHTIVSKKVQEESLTVTRERFIIDIYDTLNPATRDILKHKFKFWLNLSNERPYFDNYVTDQSDTLYPDLPFKDSMTASFSEYILDLILRKKINTYLSYQPDSELNKPLTIRAVFSTHFPPPDINHIEDPVAGEIVRKVSESIKFNNITQLHVVANKVYDFQTKKSSWKIVNITPLKAIYNYDEVFIFKAGLYKIKYQDLKPVIAAYEKLHKECIISKGIQNILDGKGVKIPEQ